LKAVTTEAKVAESIQMASYSHAMRIATWNLERKKSTTPRGAEAVEYFHSHEADIGVLTEVRTSFPDRGGHIIFSEPPKGDWFGVEERKVGLWASTGIEPVSFDSPIDLTRFVAGRVSAPLGQLIVLAVCIPWHMAGVKHDGMKPWESHIVFLGHLRELMAGIDDPFVVAGDFNQYYPRVPRTNRAAAAAMETAFEGLNIVTSGTINGCDRPGIDHIAISPQLQASNVEGWRNDATGNRLSDHDGALADLVRIGSGD
jgi:hypothetical protein